MTERKKNPPGSLDLLDKSFEEIMARFAKSKPGEVADAIAKELSLHMKEAAKRIKGAREDISRGARTSKENSVFDFLYVDHHKIGLYLSQFSDFGNLTNLVHSQRAGDETSLRGGIPSVAQGEAKESQQTGIEKHFDTQWSQVLDFLDELQTRGMVRRNSEDASIGRLLLIPGNLFLVNMRSFEKTWGVVSSEVPFATSTTIERRVERLKAKVEWRRRLRAWRA